MTDPLDDLENLLTTALIEHSNTARERKVLTKHKDFDENYRASFRDPANWLLASQVQLVHVDGPVRTLVGLFDELVHRTVPRCRRLVAAAAKREAFPFKIEEVAGPHWLPAEAWGIRAQPTKRTQDLIWALELDMGQILKADLSVCHAHLLAGGLQRLCLGEDTLFEGTSPRTLLTLPKGLDVLEGLTGGCKKDLWAFLSKETS